MDDGFTTGSGSPANINGPATFGAATTFNGTVTANDGFSETGNVNLQGGSAGGGIFMNGGSVYIDSGPSGAFNVGNATAPTPFDLGGNESITGNLQVSGTETVLNLDVTGTLTKPSGSFKIDHPLDPANKYLYHSFVESPDMMNIYNGVVVLDKRGRAVVQLPDYFEALNQDFRYQLTSIGRFMPVFVAQEIKGNKFTIAGGRPGAKISWQVTGIRHDAYAEAHRIRVEEDKGKERGTYLHPELFQQDPVVARR